jgi:hypothetical protein
LLAPLILSLSKDLNLSNYLLSLGKKGGQASSEDLLPLGYGERDRIKVRVKLSLTESILPGNKTG